MGVIGLNNNLVIMCYKKRFIEVIITQTNLAKSINNKIKSGIRGVNRNLINRKETATKTATIRRLLNVTIK